MQESSARSEVEVIEPDLPIIDCHHHLWHPSSPRYLAHEFQADILASGHNVLATVYVEGSAMYRTRGPEALRSVGEAEFVAGMAAMSDSGLVGPTRICAGFVGAADLTLAGAVDGVLEELAVASGGRLRGIRGAVVWDAEPSVNSGSRPFAPRGLLMDDRFRAGFARVAERKLVYDAWQYFPQLPELCSLADSFPDATIVVNHCGGLLGVGPYARPDNFAQWKQRVADAAQRPNVLMKLGGLAGRRTGFAYGERATRPSSEELAKDWSPYIEACIELFGAERCMFESNFPVDKVAGDYRTVWNAFKTITVSFSAEEKQALFCKTAQRVYRID
jgi:L-fuconolactonase